MSSFSSETLHPRARPAPCPSRLCLHRRGSPQTRGQMGTATTYSTARSPLRRGASCVLSDCAHNLSWDGGAIVRYFHCLLLLHARPSRGEQHVVRPLLARPLASAQSATRAVSEGHMPRGLQHKVPHSPFPYIPNLPTSRLGLCASC